MISSFENILESNRRRLFVGREQEISEIVRLISARNRQRLLFFVAPGGFGKSTLLAEIKYRAQERGIAVAHLDAQHYDPIPLQIAKTVQNVLAINKRKISDKPPLLMVDTFECWAHVETWFYTTFLPRLDSSIRIILAGRKPPGPRWRSDLGWVGLMRIMELAPFNQRETHLYLSHRKLATSDKEIIWHLSHGNPLGLALAADVCKQLGTGALERQTGKDLLQGLMLELIVEAQTASQAHALQAASVVRILSQPVLAAMLPNENAADLYNWLGQLSFMSTTDRGLFPHDLVREPVCADLRRRNPQGLEELIRRAEMFFADKLVPGGTMPAGEIISEIAYLSRHGAAPAKLVELFEADPVYPDAGTSSDVNHVCALIEQNQGSKQKKLFEYWYARQPRNLVIIRNSNHDMAGFSFFVDFGALNAAETRYDGIIDACRRFILKHGFKHGQQASLCRFWLDCQHHLSPSSVQFLVIHQMIGRAVTHNMEWGGILQADDPMTRAMADLADHKIVPGSQMVIGDTPVLVVLHDWSEESVAHWMVRANRHMRGLSGSPKSPNPEQLKKYLKHALKHFHQPDRLRENPLLQTCLAQVDDGSHEHCVSALRTRIVETSEKLRLSAKTAHYHAILKCGYFQPAKSQLAAAEMLDMAPSTYYRHLAAAVDLLSCTLHQEVLDGHRSKPPTESNVT